jgi:hypothetical protein
LHWLAGGVDRAGDGHYAAGVRFLKIGLIGTGVILALCGLVFLVIWLGDGADAPNHSTYAIAYLVPFILAAVALPVFWISVALAWAFSTAKGPQDPDDIEVRTAPMR